MRFLLDPPSGYSNSYLDIKFIVYPEIKNIPFSISLINLADNSKLNILTTSAGYIQNETDIIVNSHINVIEGYINLFNKDKMNTAFSNYDKVDIRCDMICEGHTTSQLVEFYNQSKSVDYNIIPFNISMPNTKISQNVPLIMDFVSSTEKKYELSIMGNFASYSFDVFLKNGKTSVTIPFEILLHDLNISGETKCKLYWVKFDGITYSSYVNRVFIPIDNADFTIDSQYILQSQNRTNPIDNIFDSNFVLSDRYFVHTDKEFSGFGSFLDLTSKRMANLTVFMHESQNMRKIDHSISLFSQTESLVSNKMFLRKHNLQNTIFNKSTHSSLLTTMQTNLVNPKEPIVQQNKTSGCGCSRSVSV